MAASFFASVLPAQAAPEFPAASDETRLDWTLRGGFDSNPRDRREPDGSPLLGLAADLVAQRERPHHAARLEAALRFDGYDPALSIGIAGWRVRAERTDRLGHGFSHSVSLATTRDSEDGARRMEASLRDRWEWRIGPVKAFASLEGRLARLNEANGLFEGFPPDAQDFASLSALSGLAWMGDGWELGVSGQAMRVRHADAGDYLGLDRDHDRRQPFVFASYARDGWKLEGSVSFLDARWRTRDFEPVQRLLYSAQASLPLPLPGGEWTLDAGASRSARDTSLPFAALELVTQAQARFGWRPDERHAIGLDIRERRKDYPGLGISTRTRTLAVDVARRLDARTALGLNLSARAGRATGDSRQHGYAAIVSLTRRFTWNDAAVSKRVGAGAEMPLPRPGHQLQPQP